MKIRSELNVMAADIRSAAKCWGGGEKIKIGHIDTTIAQVAQNALNQLYQYQTEEKSLKGRIETSQNLLDALNELRNKSPDPDKEKHLISTLRKVNQIISSVNQLQRDLKGKISKSIQDRNNDYINDHFVNLSLKDKIIKNSFRAIKNVAGWREEVYANYGIGGSRQMMSHMTLKQDLEQFLASYNHLMTDRQRSLIAEVLPLLAKGAEIDKEITQLLLLRLNSGAPDEVIESGIADIAYEIEKSIDALKGGETFIFPGGYTHQGGHSILYQVQRVRDGDYHFSIFNTGLGAQFGQDFLQLFKIEAGISNQFRVPLFANLKKEALVDQSFISDLIRFQVKDTSNRMDAVHQAILKQLKEKFFAVLTTREPHDLQTWGTCSYDSVAAFLEYKLPPSLFIPFQYDMMLRARNELTNLLPQGGGMDRRVVEFIDQKSCETIADWKNKFETYCDLKPNTHLFLARTVIEQAKALDEMAFRIFLENVQDFLVSTYNSEDHRNIFSRIWSGVKTVTLTTPMIAACVPLGPFLGGPACPFILGTTVGAIGGMKIAADAIIAEDFVASSKIRDYLRSFQDVLKMTTPESYKVLENRNEEFAWVPDSSKNRAIFANLQLEYMLDYLKNRYIEIAFCAAHTLTNSTFSPLREALQGCNMLK